MFGDNMNEIAKIVGNHIKIARLNKGFSQDQLAEICGVSTKYISALEVGKSNGSVGLLIKLCNILEISPNYLFGTLFNSTEEVPFNNDILIQYLKLSKTNREFVDSIITHMYNIERKK